MNNKVTNKSGINSHTKIDAFKNINDYDNGSFNEMRWSLLCSFNEQIRGKNYL